MFYFTTEGVRSLMCKGENPAEENGNDDGGDGGDGDGNGGGNITTTTPEAASAASTPGPKEEEEEGVGSPTSLLPVQGLEEVELGYVRRQAANRLQQKARFRIWVHGKFRRPLLSTSNSSN